MDFLNKILEEKAIEVAAMPVEALGSDVERPSFYQRVKNHPDKMQVIAEIKRASPSKGDINLGVDIVTQARKYQAAGVAAISVLTDPVFFKGAIGDLKAVSQVVELPLLCKDFIIDRKQLIRAKNAGASIVLLIVAALPVAKLTELFQQAHELGLEVLVETHDAEELKIAQDLGAKIIGVNNRNLKTFVVDLAVSEALAPPADGRVYVSESGIKTPADVKRVANNYQAVLVGETLMKATNTKKCAAELQVKRRDQN